VVRLWSSPPGHVTAVCTNGRSSQAAVAERAQRFLQRLNVAVCLGALKRGGSPWVNSTDRCPLAHSGPLRLDEPGDLAMHEFRSQLSRFELAQLLCGFNIWAPHLVMGIDEKRLTCA